jgi:hypothetical protein
MHLCEEFEIAVRTAHRDIEFMRDRLNAPLEYNHARRGYHYTDDKYELLGNWINESNVLSLALAVRLAFTIPDRAIKDQVAPYAGAWIKTFLVGYAVFTLELVRREKGPVSVPASFLIIPSRK